VVSATRGQNQVGERAGGLWGCNAISVHPCQSHYIQRVNTISRTLALLKPADLFPAWKWIDIMEQSG